MTTIEALELLEKTTFTSPEEKQKAKAGLFQKITQLPSFQGLPSEEKEKVRIKVIGEPQIPIAQAIPGPIGGLTALVAKAFQPISITPEQVASGIRPAEKPKTALELALPAVRKAVFFPGLTQRGAELGVEKLASKTPAGVIFDLLSLGVPGAMQAIRGFRAVPSVFAKAKALAEAEQASAFGAELEQIAKKFGISKGAEEAKAAIEIVKKKPSVVPEIAGIKVHPIQGLLDSSKEALTTGILKLENFNKMINSALESGAIAPETIKEISIAKNIMTGISNAFEGGKIVPSSEMLDIIKKFDSSIPEMAAHFRIAGSFSGKTLNQLSQFKNQMQGLLQKIAPEIETVFKEKGLLGSDPWSRLGKLSRGVEDVRRGLLVSQPATAARNAISQAGRYSLAIVTKGIGGALEALTGSVSKRAAFADSTESVLSVFRRLNPATRNELESILKRFPNEAEVLLGTPIQDVPFTNKLTHFLNGLNNMQEGFFRRMVFESRLSANLKRIGKTLQDVPNINKEFLIPLIDDAVREGLKLTFSGSPQNPFSVAGLKVFRALGPVGTATIQPFPRFWANAMDFMLDHSPLGFTKFLDPKILANLSSPDKRIAVNAFSEALTGTLAYGAGFAIRSSKFAGEKWYELRPDPNKPEKVFDMRSYAPLVFPLFVGEVIQDALRAHNNIPTRLTKRDVLEAGFSISRIAGVRNVLADFLFGERPLFGEKAGEQWGKAAMEFAGNYLASFGVPLRTISDVIGGIFNEDENIARETRDNPFKDPILETVPIVKRQLPAFQPITRTEPLKREATILRQTTGLVQRTKTFAERELGRLGISVFEVSPRTGIPEADRRIREIMAPAIQKLFEAIEKSDSYAKAAPQEQEAFLKDKIGGIRRRAFEILATEKPELDIERRIKRGQFAQTGLKQTLLQELEAIRERQKEPVNIE